MKIVVLGAGGQLGRVLVDRLSRHHDVVAGTREQADVMRAAALRQFVASQQPDAIINCAAYNKVDAAEGDPQTALAVNGFAVRALARAAAAAGAVLIHYSTDFVFDGKARQPYTEDDTPEPQSVYAQSKLIGEWMAATWPKHYVLRVESLFGGPTAKSSVDTIVRSLREGQSPRVFHDRWVSPSYVDDVADATSFLLTEGAPFGLYHCVNTGVATWLDVGQAIATLLDRPAETLTRISVTALTGAPRPQYAALSNRKLTEAGFAMPAWEDALARYLKRAHG